MAILQYDLPRNAIKESERRAAKFEKIFGAGATELDALEALYPGVLANIVSEAIQPYFSQAAADEAARRERVTASRTFAN